MEFADAVKRPFLDLKALAIGMGISTLSSLGIVGAVALGLFSIPLAVILGVFVFLLPEFMLLGYMLETAKATAKKNYKPLKWEDYFGLLKKGFFGFIISLVYGLVLLIAAVFLLGPSLLSLIMPGAELGVTELINLGVGVLVLLVMAVIVGYFVPAAYMSYITNGKFEAGFYFKTIGKKALTAKYFTAILVGGLYSAAVSVLFMLVFFLFPPLGAGISTFITRVTFYTLIGEAWASTK
jgi:hypothetical protein